MVQGEEPVIGKRYLVVATQLPGKKPFIGRTGIAKKPSGTFFDKDINVILVFDDEETQKRNMACYNYAWRAGIEVILLEVQSYVR